jgi:hypothetical protein
MIEKTCLKVNSDPFVNPRYRSRFSPDCARVTNPSISSIGLPGVGNASSISIFSASGQEMMHVSRLHEAVIDVSVLPTGLYYICVSSGEATTWEKIVKADQASGKLV